MRGHAPTGGTFPDAQPTPMLPVADPCPEIAGCAYLKANPPPTGGCSDATYTDHTVPAGCYGNLHLKGVDTLTGWYIRSSPVGWTPAMQRSPATT